MFAYAMKPLACNAGNLPGLSERLKAMRKAGINVVAIHHHMTHEEPRYIFLHYWGEGKAQELARRQAGN